MITNLEAKINNKFHPCGLMKLNRKTNIALIKSFMDNLLYRVHLNNIIITDKYRIKPE
jgi:hypothetical protein